MSKGYSVRVKICGKTYGVISDSKPEYLKDIAMRVDESIAGLMLKNSNLTLEKASILTALKFCDDANKKNINSEQNDCMQDDDNNLRKQVIEYSKELSKLSKENRELKREIEKLKKNKI